MAFCINSSLLDERATGRLELLSWLWHDEPPDLVILETLESIPDDVALSAIEMVCDTGLPVWVSFRRARDGMASVDGSVTPDPDPDAFHQGIERLEALGVSAMIVNCVPADAPAETLDWLRGQTSLPIGCYPNLGHGAGAEWEFDSSVTPARLRDARLFLARRSGARIVGGCCGVMPEIAWRRCGRCCRSRWPRAAGGLPSSGSFARTLTPAIRAPRAGSATHDPEFSRAMAA